MLIKKRNIKIKPDDWRFKLSVREFGHYFFHFKKKKHVKHTKKWVELTKFSGKIVHMIVSLKSIRCINDKQNVPEESLDSKSFIHNGFVDIT